MITIRLRPLYHGKKYNGYWLHTRSGGDQSRSGRFREKKNLLLYPGFEPRTVQPASCHSTDCSVPAAMISIIGEYRTGKDMEATDHSLMWGVTSELTGGTHKNHEKTLFKIVRLRAVKLSGPREELGCLTFDCTALTLWRHEVTYVRTRFQPHRKHTVSTSMLFDPKPHEPQYRTVCFTITVYESYIEPELSAKSFIHCNSDQPCTQTRRTLKYPEKWTPFPILLLLRHYVTRQCGGRPRAERRTTDKGEQRPLAEVPLNTCNTTNRTCKTLRHGPHNAYFP